MSKMFGFSMASSFWVIILNCSIDFNKLEGVFGYLRGTDSMSLLFGVFWICLPLFLKPNYSVL